MRNFYVTYQADEKLQPMVAEISWTKNLVIMETVSYTHLDVYKRQEATALRRGSPAGQTLYYLAENFQYFLQGRVIQKIKK